MITILQGDVVERLRELPDKSVQCVVTSPPYYGLRDYQVKGQIGLEDTPELYVQKIVEVFREVKRVLRDDGTLWLNLGDSYFGSGDKSTSGKDTQGHNSLDYRVNQNRSGYVEGLKVKDMIGIPWRVAFALQADGWYLRSDIIWNKPNPMPESVTDRPTKSHEYIFLLTKNARYFYDADAIREPATESSIARISQPTFDLQTGGDKDYGKTGVNPNRSMRKCIENFKHKNLMEDGQQPQTMHLNRVLLKQDLTGNPTYTGFNERWQLKNADRDGGFQNINRNKAILGVETAGDGITRNARTVWTITTQARPEAHFATFPDEIPRRCISAGTSERGCCPVCGASWERIVNKELTDTEGWGQATKDHTGDVQGSQSCIRDGKGRCGTSVIEQKGWQPGCKCEAGDPVSCVVLDPFGGSGTTGEIARELKRDCILIELNPAYIKIMRKRLRLGEQLVSE
jgi:DNA modification methylase